MSGAQFGTGIELEMMVLCDGRIDSVGLVVNALAMKPANTIEKMEAWTVSFII